MARSSCFNNVRLLVCDFDGVFTDDSVIVDENGTESVICSRADGLGVEMLKKSEINVIVISRERNNVVQARCRKMGIRCSCGVKDKIKILKKEMQRYKVKPDEVCYIGNDITDCECIKYVVGVAVGDAAEQVKKVAKFVTKNKGGKGAVREIADILLSAKQV